MSDRGPDLVTCQYWQERVLALVCSHVCCRDMACSVAGITSDANVLTDQLRLIAQRFVLI